ncbi:hypothetical protein [Fretibacterium fastidiosum]|uniref:hypothetical protein n=1 Tax=Fretibacterium fastidiosum TaxID=651822 RepID=UPI001FB16A38|nr:hypothetical protein [Fretibacterium fastidiosum]
MIAGTAVSANFPTFFEALSPAAVGEHDVGHPSDLGDGVEDHEADAGAEAKGHQLCRRVGDHQVGHSKQVAVLHN